MAEPPSTAPLEQSVAAFMRYFIAHINPILHRAKHGGRNYSELEIIVCMGLSVVGPMRPGDLSRGLSIEKATMTSVIRRLRGLGLIERREIAGDERSYLVALTPAGRRFIRRLEAQRRDGFARLFGAMAQDEIAAAAHEFDLVTRYLKKMEHDNRMGSQGSR